MRPTSQASTVRRSGALRTLSLSNSSKWAMPKAARAVPGARIDYDDRRFLGIDAVLPALLADLGDPEQGVVRRMPETTCVEDRLGLEVEKRRQPGPLVLQHGVGAQTKRVPEQDRALPEIALIREDRVHGQLRGQCPGSASRRGLSGNGGGPAQGGAPPLRSTVSLGFGIRDGHDGYPLRVAKKL